MTDSAAPKVRLVKCPRCRELLRESADVPVYRCGGCSVILQAKYWRNDAKDTGSDIREESSIPTEKSAYGNGSEDKQSSSTRNEMMIPSSEDSSVNLNGLGERETSICHNPEQAEEAQFCNGDLNNGKSGSESGNIDVEENGELEEPCLSAAVSSHDNNQSSQIGETMEGQLKEESLPIPEANSVLEANNGAIDSKNDSPRTVSGSSSQVTEEGLAEENILASDAPLLSSGEQKEQLQTDVAIRHAFERMTSKETFASTEYVDPVSEFSDALGDMSVSPAARSSHAYEGSVSSYDAFEDQYHDRDFHKFKYPGEKMNSVPSKERRNRGKYRVNGLVGRDARVRHPDRHFALPFSSDMGLYAMKGSRWVQNGMAEPSSHVPPSRYHIGSERDELPPRIPRQPGAGYDHGSPSSQVYPEHDKLKLLKMVYELEDQLKRTCNLDEVASERVSAGFNWKEKHSRMYYDGGLLEESNSPGLNVPGYLRRSEPRNNWRSSKIPFSAEMTKRSYQYNHTHLRHFPPEYRRSEPLPPPNIYNRGLYGFHDTRNPYSPYSSCASSPQRYMDDEPSMGDSETNSNHRRYKIREFNNYFRENHHVVKRHLRPITGGAPLLTCDRCSELLQLPADFLFFKKRCHRLRCGACKAVLKFSVQNRIHIVPYVRDAEAPPPSEAEDYDDSMNRRRYPPTSHANGFPQAEPVSCSDDYGLSIGKSCSTEGDPALSAQFHALDDSTQEKMKSSLNQCRNKQNSLPGIYKSACCSGQNGMSPDAEGLPRRSNSPLHQLMGYCSVSQVFRGPEPSDAGASSSSQKKSGS
ncbi:protein ENHANCED DISEASE RESISTANCE 4-like [Rhodamnia argentea]|uniref:Protein ENHANCED DISEASE RESISTANCE 4-like n=1 Tax=Rhodamnia argentea TaxID=178133 RepID=A0A8B8Q0E6_9MYRT|nr:protein ENHANCED DISEASE RESISTANCE 4-like [Rhodamnia argentea]XP_030540548.1 protein ENHANCED DISEASE RESISTANCE 4-like [Rhodamnia argentea]XP_030540549.1 protein ENHANCED DISEASE RESISTANCE 4-like [Rhodamnia argentea]XP_048139693.1 protein ENHANCED DISEASE RESISTANCE 4-like [Rhodamnia argentea]